MSCSEGCRNAVIVPLCLNVPIRRRCRPPAPFWLAKSALLTLEFLLGEPDSQSQNHSRRSLRFWLRGAGWPTGLEPATTRTTIWGSTIELRPPSLTRRQDLKIPILFCKQRTRLFPVTPLIVGAGGTKICLQLDCRLGLSWREASCLDFFRQLVFPCSDRSAVGAGGRSE